MDFVAQKKTCNYTKYWIEKDSSELCAANRDPEVALCGKCLDGYSEKYNTSQCGKCSAHYSSFLYFPLTYILEKQRKTKEKKV